MATYTPKAGLEQTLPWSPREEPTSTFRLPSSEGDTVNACSLSQAFLTPSRTLRGLPDNTPLPPCPPPLICREILAYKAFPKFQRADLIRGVRKCLNKGKSQAKQNNSSLAIKPSRGPLVPPQGLQIISWACPRAVLQILKPPLGGEVKCMLLTSA